MSKIQLQNLLIKAKYLNISRKIKSIIQAIRMKAQLTDWSLQMSSVSQR